MDVFVFYVIVVLSKVRNGAVLTPPVPRFYPVRIRNETTA
jgi:hypothetical protein